MGLNYQYCKQEKSDGAEFAKEHFAKDDITVYLAYTDEQLTHEPEAAVNDLANYIKRVRRLWGQRTGRDEKEFKYVGTTEVSPKGRFHHHLILSAGIPPEELPTKWKKGDTVIKPLFNDKGEPEIMNHINKPCRSYRRFTASHNLPICL